MLTQIEIDFVHKSERLPETKAILNSNREHLNNQCKLIITLLESGKSLTVREAMITYGIGALSQRVHDLRRSGFEIKDRLVNNRHKEYFI